MKVLLNLVSSDAALEKHFIVGWALRYFAANRNQECILVSTQLISETPANLSQVVLQPPSGKVAYAAWKRFKLEPAIRRQNCDIVMSLEPVRAINSVKLILIASLIGTIRNEHHGKKKSLNAFKKFNTCSGIIVFSEVEKRWIMEHYPEMSNRTSVVYRISDENIYPPSFEKREATKEKYAEGNEYFIVSPESTQEQLIAVLKGYSGFKKWQKSSMKLMLVGGEAREAEAIKTLLSNYKFKNSVTFISKYNSDYLQILASAYAAILPARLDNDLDFLFTSMRAAVPVLVSESGIYAEVMEGDKLTFLYNDKASVTKGLLQVFQQEALRSKQIERQKEIIDKYRYYKPEEEFFNAFTM